MHDDIINYDMFNQNDNDKNENENDAWWWKMHDEDENENDAWWWKMHDERCMMNDVWIINTTYLIMISIKWIDVLTLRMLRASSYL